MRGELGEFVELLPARSAWKPPGTRARRTRCTRISTLFAPHQPGSLLILAGDHIYKMDYGAMLAAHAEAEADITVGCIGATGGGLGLRGHGRRRRQPHHRVRRSTPPPCRGAGTSPWPPQRKYLRVPHRRADRGYCATPTCQLKHDFGGNIIPDLINRLRVTAFPFTKPGTDAQAYWRDVGTIDAYWQANMELIDISRNSTCTTRNGPSGPTGPGAPKIHYSTTRGAAAR